ncbi:MAG: mechanosensitive ion channel [Candidatus Omnitrophica bacterium]|nr:mechanosensitive ion channel [Candidatus Omnitrophota bacterium]MDE2231799.1 mechanosensitive ion channel [Candidatus Omnitrophota bacterium]
MSNIQFSLIIFLFALLAGLVLHSIAAMLIKRRPKPSVAGRSLNIRYLIEPLRYLIPGVCVAVVLPWLHFPLEIQSFGMHAAQLWIIASVGWLLMKSVHMVRDMVLEHYDVTVADNLRARKMFTQIRVIGRIINILIVFLTFAIMVMTFNEARQVGLSLLASAGILGVVLGFAAQKTLGNLMAGIQIAFAQPIRLDDVVIVENEWGWIEEITLTYVVVRIWDLRRLILPISYFVEKPFQNWTRVSADLLGTVFVYTDYLIDVQGVREALTRILGQSRLWDKKVNVLQVTNLSEHTVELRALMSASDSSKAWDLRCEVREKLLNYMQTQHPDSLPRTRVEMQKRPEPNMESGRLSQKEE